MAQRRFYDLEDQRGLQTFQKLIFDDDENENPTLIEYFDDDQDAEADEGPAEERMGDSDSVGSGTDEGRDPINELIYLGKDGATKWLKVPRQMKCRSQPQNTIRRLPGVIGVTSFST